jgi:hypothetical protein
MRSKGMRVEELSAAVIRCMSKADREALGIWNAGIGNAGMPGAPDGAVVVKSARRGPTKTELEFARRHLAGKAARFEALAFRLANGHRYTPDWVYVEGGRLVCVEVKGSRRLGSYQRARVAFDQAVVEWPGVRWIWAERSEDGSWRVSEKEAGHGMPQV